MFCCNIKKGRQSAPKDILLRIRLLAVVCQPFTFGLFHISECCSKRRIFCTAGIDSKSDRILYIKHMANPHLFKVYTVGGIFNAKIIFSSAQTKPDRFYRGIHIHRSPIGISVVGYNTAKTLYTLIFIKILLRLNYSAYEKSVINSSEDSEYSFPFLE